MEPQEIKLKCYETGVILRGKITFPQNIKEPYPLIIMLSGDVRGSNSNSTGALRDRFLKNNVAVFTFDYQGIGNSDGSKKDLNLTTAINNFYQFFKEVYNLEYIDKNRIGIFAVSYGASVLLTSPKIANKAKIICLKSPCTFLPEVFFEEIGLENYLKWKKEGYSEVNNYNFGAFLDPFKYDIFNLAKQIKTKCYITHGKNDQIVPLTQTICLVENLITEPELKIIPEANHNYSTLGSWEKMASYFVKIFKENL